MLPLPRLSLIIPPILTFPSMGRHRSQWRLVRFGVYPHCERIPTVQLDPPVLTQLVDITDGTSNTLLLSEMMVSPDGSNPSVGSGHDNRGRMYNSAFVGSPLFTTLNPPNTTQPDELLYCQTIPTSPCFDTGYTGAVNMSARSYHGGANTNQSFGSLGGYGVNCAMADGSVKFILNSINAQTWKSLGSRNGGESLPESY